MKKAMKGIVGILVVVLSSALICACGGGGGSSSSPKVTSGVFANVSGLGFSAGTQTGTTGAAGKFTYLAGDTAVFKVGDIVVGQAAAGSLLTPLQLFPGADAGTTNVVNIMRLLMSVGTYDDAKLTIAIPSAVLNAAKNKSIDFATATDQALLDLVKQLTANNSATLVDAPTATAFLSRLIYKYFGGTYTGTFTGPASSNTWQMTISTSDGTVSGMGLDGAKESLSGSMSKGVVFNGFATGDCVLSGRLNLTTMKFEGDWTYTDPLNIRPSQTGKFTGSR